MLQLTTIQDQLQAGTQTDVNEGAAIRELQIGQRDHEHCITVLESRHRD